MTMAGTWTSYKVPPVCALEGYCHLLAHSSQFFFVLFFVYWKMWLLYYNEPNHSLPTSPLMYMIPFSFNKYTTFPTAYNHFRTGSWQENVLSSYGYAKHHQQIINAFYWTKEGPPQRLHTVWIHAYNIQEKVRL